MGKPLSMAKTSRPKSGEDIYDRENGNRHHGAEPYMTSRPAGAPGHRGKGCEPPSGRALPLWQHANAAPVHPPCPEGRKVAVEADDPLVLELLDRSAP
jgi:hypothetical protein